MEVSRAERARPGPTTEILLLGPVERAPYYGVRLLPKFFHGAALDFVVIRCWHRRSVNLREHSFQPISRGSYREPNVWMRHASAAG